MSVPLRLSPTESSILYLQINDAPYEIPQRSALSVRDNPTAMHFIYFIHTDMSLRVPLNNVFSVMEKVFPQSPQMNFCVPFLRLRLRRACVTPHIGHTLPPENRCSVRYSSRPSTLPTGSFSMDCSRIRSSLGRCFSITKKISLLLYKSDYFFLSTIHQLLHYKLSHIFSGGIYIGTYSTLPLL